MAGDIKDNPITQQMLADIAHVQWQLDLVQDSATHTPFPKAPPVTIMLEETGKVTGSAPVNRYFGEFELKDNGVIQWNSPGFGATMMAGPPELMELEQYYLNSLHQCNRLSISDSRLVFSRHASELRLEYTKQ
jgi:heat shock protein HslJ